MAQAAKGQPLPEAEQPRSLIDDWIATASEQLTALLVTDLEASTEALVRLGDGRARQAIQRHDSILRARIAAFDGVEVTHVGDGVLASFRSIHNALHCARSIQHAFALQRQTEPEWPMAVRIGVHAGEPLAVDRRLFGISVNTVFRICNHAEPGSVHTSEVVRQLAAGIDGAFVDQGWIDLKGLPEPQRLYAMRWRDEAQAEDRAHTRGAA